MTGTRFSSRKHVPERLKTLSLHVSREMRDNFGSRTDVSVKGTFNNVSVSLSVLFVSAWQCRAVLLPNWLVVLFFNPNLAKDSNNVWPVFFKSLQCLSNRVLQVVLSSWRPEGVPDWSEFSQNLSGLWIGPAWEKGVYVNNEPANDQWRKEEPLSSRMQARELRRQSILCPCHDSADLSMLFCLHAQPFPPSALQRCLPSGGSKL